MVEVLQSSNNPKHRNSEFLKFLKKLNSGALEIKDDSSLVENQAKMAEFEKQEQARLEAEAKRMEEEEKYKQMHLEHIR